MIIPDQLLKEIAEKNLEMFFARNVFQIEIEHIKHTLLLKIYPADRHDSPLSAILEINCKERRKMMTFMSVQLYCEAIDDDFLEFVKCCQEIQIKIDQISCYQKIYYGYEDRLLVNFTEIGIDKDDLTRDLIVKRDGDISLISFKEDGTATTTAFLSIDEFVEYLDKIDDVNIDYCGATFVYLTDYDRYDDSDIDDEDE